jgi:arginine-tRNA-protein transferase
MILDHVEFARAQGHPFVYLGYWIEGSRKMRYKNRFQPQQSLTSKGWVSTSSETPAGETREEPATKRQKPQRP